MNDVAIKGQDLPKLRPGPLALYVLFWNAVRENKVLSRSELFAVYKEHVATGESDRFVHSKEKGHGVWEYVPWNEWEWQRNFETWFVYTLGSLLKKGYLKVVPAVDLSKVDSRQLLDNEEAEQRPTTTVCSEG